MNPQEVFNTAAKALLDQKVPSAKHEGEGAMGTSCLYRGPNGTKCAIGHLIPDEHYNRCMEGAAVPSKDSYRTVAASHLVEALEASGFSGAEDFRFLRQLQACHDDAVKESNDSGHIENFSPRPYLVALVDNLRKFAIEFNLNPEVLGETVPTPA